jgi:N-acetyl sugar amidotransferase
MNSKILNNNDIQFCKRCLYSSLHPLGITFNHLGICSGCQVHEEKNYLDWSYRWEKIKKIIKPYISISGKNYDCVIPVTGGQDSYFIVHSAKKLGLKPLLVTYNKYFNTPLGIKNLANLRTKFDCDILFQNINPVSVKKITRYTFMEHGNMYWPIIAGSTVFPVQIAAKYKIPLIIWGAHQGLEQVGMFSHEHEVEMTRRYRQDHDLFGNEAEDLISLSNDLKEEDVWQYNYPDDKTINSVGIRGIYLGNYLRWDPVEQHQKMIKAYGYKTSNFLRTFDTYDYVDCFNYMNLHDYLKICKHGYSKVTDHASREIRHNRITRDQGIKLIRNYELKAPEFTDLFCEWLGLSGQKALNYLINRNRNKKFWKEKEIDNWKFKGLSTLLTSTKNNIQASKNVKRFFLANGKLKYNKDNSYITFGKGI